MARLSRRVLARVEREFSRLGLLLLQDPVLPSFTTLAVGGPIRGSWWSHPQAHEIYDLLQLFHDGTGALSVKLINGKVTYVHRRLWPALLNVARGRATWQRQALSPEARSLLRTVVRREAIRADRLKVPPESERSAAIRELEARLLLHSSSVHTETGAHRKLLRSWSRWCADSGYSFKQYSSAEGRAELEHAAQRVLVSGGPVVKLPWSVLRGSRLTRDCG
jgi:hypothetical protein